MLLNRYSGNHQKAHCCRKFAKTTGDSKITELLEEKGINVARRTIAKYRESLSIPPSNERKDFHTENSCTRQHPINSNTNNMQLEDILLPQRCFCKVPWHNKRRILTNISELISDQFEGLEPEPMYDSLMAREQLGNGACNGIAIPHCRVANAPKS